MKLIKASFEQFAHYIKHKNKKVVMFGSGAIGKVLIPYISNYYEFDEQILCYIDNNPAKRQMKVELATRKVAVYSIEYLQSVEMGDIVLMVTNGDFGPVLSQLQGIENLQETEVFLAPVMQLMEKSLMGGSGIVRTETEPIIPKIIHYCWFSGNPIPENLNRCIASWKEKCPDYEVVRWDETNYDVGKLLYTKQAYEAGKWGFIPDIARLEILYENGGFYLDTDVELLKSLDELRYQRAFCAREEWGHVNFGGGSGCIKHFGLIGDILAFRREIPFLLPDGRYNLEASGYYETRPLVQRGLTVRNKTETIEKMTVYASEFFHPYNYISGTENITENTISIHYFNGSWLGDNGKKYRLETRQKFYSIISHMDELDDR